ncbi:MAG: S9 family peptidase [Acidobacteria bacterium]|nr:S9 family peptidase [Acidobacteriota bacterium]
MSNDLKHEVEAWLVRPIGLTATSSHPLIVNIHGGPHGVQGPAFNLQNQVCAGLGWAVLMVNYRGSIGYGQAWSDGVFRDQNGDEAQDVLYGVNAAIRRYTDRPQSPRRRGGSYGGQLSAWLVTITNIFKAAIPRWPVINPSPTTTGPTTRCTRRWNSARRSIRPTGSTSALAPVIDPLRQRREDADHADARENDNDVPIAESEQFYMGLKDAGVETVMVRYPREGTRTARTEAHGGHDYAVYFLVPEALSSESLSAKRRLRIGKVGG